jgi:hypothetical protein
MNNRNAFLLLVFAILATTAERATPQSLAAARLVNADRERFPRAQWPHLSYLDLSPAVGQERKDLEASIRFMLASTTLEPVVERVLPQKLIGTDMLRIDLRELGWSVEDWRAVVKEYPYSAIDWPLVVRADWLLVEWADLQDSKSGAYMRLLFGGKSPPKTRDDVFKRLGVGSEQKYLFGIIEGDSQVAVRKGGRVIESRPIQRGFAYITRDVLRLTKERNPLENLQAVARGSSQHDGEEVIVMIPKVSQTNGDRGALPIYFLANGKGELVNRAPVDLVEDHRRFRNFAEIRFPGACFVSCHSGGYNLPTRHEFRELSKDGVLPFASDRQTAADVQAFFVAELKKEIGRANDDQQTMIELVTGMPHDQFAAAYKRAVDRYDAPLDMQAAAEEFVRYGWQVGEVVAGIELAANEGRIGVALAGIARNRPIDREAFEEEYNTLLTEIARSQP